MATPASASISARDLGADVGAGGALGAGGAGAAPPMPRRPFNASPPVGALGAGGMATGAGTGTGTGPAGALPPARESQNAAASPGPGEVPGGPVP